MPTITIVSVPSQATFPDESQYAYFCFEDQANPMYDENFQPILTQEGTPEYFRMYVPVMIPDDMQPTAENIAVLEAQGVEQAKAIATQRAYGIVRTQNFRPLINTYATGEPESLFSGEV